MIRRWTDVTVDGLRAARDEAQDEFTMRLVCAGVTEQEAHYLRVKARSAAEAKARHALWSDLSYDLDGRDDEDVLMAMVMTATDQAAHAWGSASQRLEDDCEDARSSDGSRLDRVEGKRLARAAYMAAYAEGRYLATTEAYTKACAELRRAIVG